MSNRDYFIGNTPHGNLMKSGDNFICIKCKYNNIQDCKKITDYLCMDSNHYYFAKDETEGQTDENSNH